MLMPNKDTKELIAALEDQGWRVVPTRNGHWQAFPPDKSFSPVYLPSTPSDHRSHANSIAELRRRGFTWKGR